MLHCYRSNLPEQPFGQTAARPESDTPEGRNVVGSQCRDVSAAAAKQQLFDQASLRWRSDQRRV